MRGLPKIWDGFRFYEPSKHKNEAKSSMISAMPYFSHFNNFKNWWNCVIITQASFVKQNAFMAIFKFTPVKPHITPARAEILEPNSWRTKQESRVLPDHTVQSPGSLTSSQGCAAGSWSARLWFLALFSSTFLKEEPEGEQNLRPQNMPLRQKYYFMLIIFKKQQTKAKLWKLSGS